MRVMVLVKAIEDSEASDFGEEYTPEVAEQEERLRQGLARG